MSSIRCLNRLTALYLNHQSARSDISNLGLAELAQMSSLRRLELRTNCSVTALGLTCSRGKAVQTISALAPSVQVPSPSHTCNSQVDWQC